MIDSISSEIQKSVSKENLSIEVTTQCTSNCTYCFVRSGRTGNQELDYKTALSVLTEGYELGYRHLHITGGEPLLWGHLFDVLCDAEKIGYESIFLNINGFLLDSKSANQLASIKGISLSISLLGFQEINDSFRGDGTFVKATRGIEIALNYTIPVYLFSVVGKSHLAHLPHFVKWTYQQFPGIQDITLIQLIRVLGDVVDVSQELLSPGDFVSLVNMISFLNMYGFSVTLLENPLANVVAQLLQLPWFSSPPHLCRPGRLTIRADRTITVAHSSPQSLGMYSAGELSRILISKMYKSAVEEDNSTCSSCNHKVVCCKAGLLRPSEPFRNMYEDIPYCKCVLDSLKKSQSIYFH